MLTDLTDRGCRFGEPRCSLQRQRTPRLLCRSQESAGEARIEPNITPLVVAYLFWMARIVLGHPFHNTAPPYLQNGQ